MVLRFAIYGCKSSGEFLDMLLESFIIGTSVQMILTLIKRGYKIMKDKIERMQNRVQRPKHNKQELKRKSYLAWV